MRRAKRLNYYFNEEFRAQKGVMDIYDRKTLKVEGCPLYEVYQTACVQLDARLKDPAVNVANVVRLAQKYGAHQTACRWKTSSRRNLLKQESGLIWLSVAASGAPFIGLLSTVWGVMSAFAGITLSRLRFTGRHGARCRGCLDHTTVAGLIVAIPSMFGYNWLVHNLRAFTVGLDNFAQG